MTAMTRDTLFRAWLVLILLSGGSAIISELVTSGFDRRVAGVLIVVLAMLKARVILTRYLGLSQAPSWRSGFTLALSFFCAVLLGLYLIPSFIA